MGFLTGFKINEVVIKYVLIFIAILVISFFINNEIDAVRGMFGLETKASLKLKTEEDAKLIKDQNDKINNLKNELSKKDNSDKVSSKTVYDNKVNENNVNNHYRDNNDKRVRDIKLVIDKSLTIKEDEVALSKDISTVQINSIWEQYCSFNTDIKCEVK